MGKVSWRWKGREIEEMREIKYLGYTVQRNGGQEVQVRDRQGERYWDRCGE